MTSTTIRVDTSHHTGLPDDLTANLSPSVDDALRVQLTRFTYPYSDIYVITRVVHDTADAFHAAVDTYREKINRRNPDTRTYAMLRAAAPDVKFPGVLDVHHIITNRTAANRTREVFIKNTAALTGSWEDGSVATIYQDGNASAVTGNQATALELDDGADPEVDTIALTNHTTAYAASTTYHMITDSGDGTTADALASAACVLGADALRPILNQKYPQARAFILQKTGATTELSTIDKTCRHGSQTPAPDHPRP